MFCFIIPLYNSFETIEFSILKLNVILEHAKNNGIDIPLIFVEDKGDSENFIKTKEYILNKLSSFRSNILFIRNRVNNDISANLNQVIDLLLKKKISYKEEIKFVLIRDSDDYITTQNYDNAIECMKNNYFLYSGIKIDVRNNEISDWKLFAEYQNDFNSLKKEELDFFKLNGNNDNIFFNDDFNIKTVNTNMQLLVNQEKYFYTEYYDLFNVYAMSVYSLDVFKKTGGFKLYCADSAGDKASDLNKIKILINQIKIFLKKAYLISLEKDYQVTDEISNNLTFLNQVTEKYKIPPLIKDMVVYGKESEIALMPIPTIFRMVRSDSHSQKHIRDKVYNEFSEMDIYAKSKNESYKFLRYLRQSGMILNKNTLEELSSLYVNITKFIFNSMQIPILYEKGIEIIHKGDFWKV